MKTKKKKTKKEPELSQEKPQDNKNSILEKLEAAAKDLLYISETDAPLEPFFWPTESEELTPEFIKQQAKLPDDAPVSTQVLDELFEPVAIEEEWMNDEEIAEARRFQNLQTTLEENLKDVKVFRFGETDLDVFIVGKTDDGLAGVRTKVVET
ncbi:MAG TPA: nuclease A inhibitor family protein [Abditibacteriaceae bacterium]|jgi:hypothetical protein